MNNNTLDEDFLKQEEIISPIKWWESRRKNYNKKILPVMFIIGCLIDIIFRHSVFEADKYFEWIGTAIGTYIGLLFFTNILFSVPEVLEIIYKLLSNKTFKIHLREIAEKIFLIIIIFITLAFFTTY